MCHPLAVHAHTPYSFLQAGHDSTAGAEVRCGVLYPSDGLLLTLMKQGGAIPIARTNVPQVRSLRPGRPSHPTLAATTACRGNHGLHCACCKRARAAVRLWAFGCCVRIGGSRLGHLRLRFAGCCRVRAMQLLMLPESMNTVFGTTLNPWNKDR